MNAELKSYHYELTMLYDSARKFMFRRVIAFCYSQNMPYCERLRCSGLLSYWSDLITA